ncbi:MAG: hypothetical protein JWN71_3923 [Xanthobacteraceae bacterium]|nr:hypothetical protein [Xanthobacteraceae bacterium]
MQSDDIEIRLGFEELDELAFSLTSKAARAPPHYRIVPNNLGPLVELEWLRRSGVQLPHLGQLKNTHRLTLLKTALSSQGNPSFENSEAQSHLICCNWDKDEEPDEWFNFCQSMQKAATKFGFPLRNAQELVAGVRELVSNIRDHSGAPNTGLAAYSFRQRELELLIADEGMGVLKSLRTSPEFHALRDSGEALRAALTDGNSRFGKESGHGGGFRDLFHGLLNLSSSLRFRSGDHALTIDGVSPGLAQARIRQKTQLSGFVISILCIR